MTLSRFSLCIWICAILVSGCSNRFQEIQVDGRFFVSIPSYFKPVDNLHESAPLQVGSRLKDVYLLARYEPKKPFVQKKRGFTSLDFYDATVDNLLVTLEKPVFTDPDRLVIDGMPALSGEISGLFRGTEVAYRLWVIESSQNYYQLLCWRRMNDSIPYAQDFDSIARSFRLVYSP